MKKILVLNGSPRIVGNTSCLIKEFERGAKESGNEVQIFNLGKMNIHGCLGCFGGGKNAECPCVQKDDMIQIYQYFKDADVVVLASPLYYWTISGQLKMAFDRLFAVEELKREYARGNKGAILIMAGAGNGFEESKYWFNGMLKHMEWDNLGEILVGGVHNIGDIKERTEELQKAYELGKSIK